MLFRSGKYVFEVAKAANKIQIADAVAEIFKVKVLSVNTVHVTGKVKRVDSNIQNKVAVPDSDARRFSP